MLSVPHLLPPPRPPQDASPLVFELTSATDGRTHLCRVVAVELAVTDGAGRFPALCGDEVLAASLAAPADRPCTACHAQLHRLPGRAA